MAFRTSCFPDMLKQAEVTPIYKKNYVMDKRNYRPVSILPTVSKISEKVMLEQLNVHFDPIRSPYTSGFRKGYSCENVLLHLAQKVSPPLRGGGGGHESFEGGQGGGGHKSLTLPAGRIVTLYAEIYGPHSMNRPACKNSSIKICIQLV